MIRPLSASSAMYRLLTTTPLTAAVSGQNGIQWYMTSPEAPSPDCDEYGHRCQASSNLCDREGRHNRRCPSAERRTLDVTQDEQASERALRLALLGICEGGDQIGR